MIIPGAKIIHANISYTITGICFEVHNELGRFAKEKHYGDLFEEKLRNKSITYIREFKIEKTGDKVDFLIDGEIVIEIKAKNIILKNDYYQTQRYLHSLNKKLALLVNFRNRYIKPIRVLNADVH